MMDISHMLLQQMIQIIPVFSSKASINQLQHTCVDPDEAFDVIQQPTTNHHISTAPIYIYIYIYIKE